MASPSTISFFAIRRLSAVPSPAQSRIVWKTRRVLTGASLAPGATPGPTTTSGTCIVAWYRSLPCCGLAVVAEPLAVIARDDDRNGSPGALLERPHQAPELLVHRRDFAEVRARPVAASKRLGRGVRVVRVVVVHPEQHWLRFGLLQIGDGPVGGLLGRALGRELVVVQVEAAREAEAPRQHEARHERRGSVAGLAEPLRQQWVAAGQGAGVLVHAVAGRVEARQHRRVRGKRLGHRRVRLAKPQASARERVERRRLDSRCVRADRVRARRVERHEQDRRPSRSVARGRRRPRARAASRQERDPGEQNRPNPRCCGAPGHSLRKNLGGPSRPAACARLTRPGPPPRRNRKTPPAERCWSG